MSNFDLAAFPDLENIVHYRKGRDFFSLKESVKNCCSNNTFSDLAALHLRRFLSSEKTCQKSVLEKLSSDKFLGVMNNGNWDIVDNENIIAVVKRVPTVELDQLRHVAISSTDILIGFFGTGTAKVNIFRKIGDACCDIFKAEEKIELSESFVAEPGDIISIQRDVATAELTLLTGELRMLQVASTSRSPITWYFNRQTNKSEYAVSSSADATHLEFLLDLIGYLSDQGQVPDKMERISKVIDRLTSSEPRHFVRWKAAKASALVSRQFAISTLENLKSDRHPHVASAAARSIQNLVDGSHSE